MSHHSNIICDKCGAVVPCEGGPYPPGWVLVTIHKYNGPQTLKDSVDLCSECFRTMRLAIEPMRSPP